MKTNCESDFLTHLCNKNFVIQFCVSSPFPWWLSEVWSILIVNVNSLRFVPQIYRNWSESLWLFLNERLGNVFSMVLSEENTLSV